MAKKIDVKEELRTGLSELAQQIKGARMPAGGTDQTEENQYTEMDMIAGICSAALFGVANRDKDSYKNLTANPKLSYLGQILDILTSITGYIVPDEKVQAQKDKNLLQTINKSNPIKVELAKVSNGVFDNIEFIINNKEKNKESNKEKSSTNELVIELQGIKNLKDLDNTLLDIKEHTNDVGLIDGINGIITTISELNKLSQVDTTKIIESFRNIQQLNIDYVELDKSLKIDDKIKDSIEESCKSLASIVTSINEFINNIPSDIKENILLNKNNELKDIINNLKEVIKEFDSNEFKDFDKIFTTVNFTDIFRSILKFDKKFVSEHLNDLKEKLAVLHGYLSNQDDSEISIKTIFNDISELAKSAKVDGDSNVKVLSNILSVVLDLISNDIKINTTSLIKIHSITREHGIIDQILTDISRIGSKEINKNVKEAINVIGNYFEALKSATDIGIIGRFRIMSNMKFVKKFVNRELPGLIVDINKNFENLEVKGLKGLNNLVGFFNFISKLGEIPVKRKLRMYNNLKFIKYFVLEDIIGMINEINTKIQNESKNMDLKALSTLLDNIFKIADFDSKKLDNTEDVLEDLYDILLEGDYSLIAIFKKINENQSIYSESINSISNLEEACDQLFTAITQIKVDEKAIKKFISPATLLRYVELPLINSIAEYINKNLIINNDIAEKIEAIKKTYFDPLLKLNQDIIKSEAIFVNIEKVFESIIKLNKKIKFIAKNEKFLKAFQTVLEKEADIINTFINKFDNIESEKIQNAANVVQELSKLILISAAVLIIGAFAMNFIDVVNLFLFASTLILFVTAMSFVAILISKFFDNKKIDQLNVTLDALKDFILFSSIVLVFSSLIMNFINVKNLFAFAFTLFTFLLGMTAIIYILQSIGDVEKMTQTARQFGELVLICGLTLIFGALITSLVSFESLFKFAFNLALFMVMLALPLWLYKQISATIFEGAAEFGKLVFLCGLILAFGALLTQYLLWEDIFKFAFNLGLFMIMLSVPLYVFSMVKKSLLRHAKDFGYLVMMCGLTLVLGALFMRIDGLWLDALKFTGIFFLFMLGLSLALALGSKIAGKKGIKFGHEISVLVGICALTLVLGPLIVNHFLGGDYEQVLYFAIILGLFIAGVSIAFGFASKLMGTVGIAVAIGFSIVVLVSAMSLVLGPILLKQYGVTYDDVLLFGLMILGFVTVFAVILGIMGAFASFIGLGLLCAAGIGVLTFGLAWVMAESYQMLSPINWEEFWEQWTNVGELVLIITGVVGLISLAAPVIAIGSVMMMLLEGVIWGLAKCITASVFAVLQLQKIKGVDVEELMVPFGDFIKYGLKAVLDNFGFWSALKFKAVQGSVKQLAEIIGLVAARIKEYSELKIAIYDESGKFTGYRNMTNQDFENAAQNIALIITCVGGAIMGLFGIGPQAANMTDAQKEVAMEMLKVEGGGWFSSGKTKFGMIVEASAGLGKVINEIAEGTMTWSKLPKDFDAEAAAKNIGLIVTCVGGSLMGLFGLGPFAGETSPAQQEVAMEMLKVEGGGWFRTGKTKFGMIVEASTGLGRVINEIAEGAKKYSELPSDFDVSKIATNVYLIITVLGKALMNLYDTDIGREMFAPTGSGIFSLFTGNRDNKFKRVADSVGQLGSMICNIMEGVQAYANLTVPTKWNEEGKAIEFRNMEDWEFFMAQYNIGKLITTLGEAVIKVGQSDLFLTIFGGEALKDISEAIVNVSQTVSPIADSIWMYAQGMFPKLKYEDGKLVTYDWFDCNKEPGGIDAVIKRATDNIGKMIIGFAGIFADSMANEKFEELVDDPEDVMALGQSISALANTTSTIFDIINKLLEKPMLSPMVQMFVVDPFNTFVKGVMWSTRDEDKDVKFWMLDHTGDMKDYKEGLTELSKGVFTTFDTLNKIIALGIIPKPFVEYFIVDPFNTFIEGVMWEKKDKDKDLKYWLLDNTGDVKDYKNNLTELSKGIFTTFDIMNQILSFRLFTKDGISDNIVDPFNKFVSGVMWEKKDKDNDIKYWLLDNTEDVTDYKNNLTELSKGILNIFEGIKKIIDYKITSAQVTLRIVNVLNTLLKELPNIKTSLESYDRLSFIKIENISDILYNTFDNIRRIIKMNISNRQILLLIKTLSMYLQIIPLLQKYSEKYTNSVSYSINKFRKDLFGIISLLALVNKNTLKNAKKITKSVVVLWEATSILKRYTKEDSKIINDYISDLRKYIILVQYLIKRDFNKNSNVLKDSIDKIFESVSNIDNNEEFDKHTETLKKYVEAINSVKIENVQSMTDLANSVTQLGDRIGNIDKFTNTLAGRVSETLQALAKQIKNASIIIKNADQLHKKRETTIKDSVGKIKDLMEKEMVVKIQKEDEAQPGTGGDTPSFVPSSPDSASDGSSTSLGGDSTGGGSNSITGTMTQSGSSGGGQSITIDIDENALAIAIVKALKEAKIQV